MYAITAAADVLGVTPRALRKALQRGETIASLTQACGLDLDVMTAKIVDSEVPDVEALAKIAGFRDDDVSRFSTEMRDYLVSFIQHGEQAANALFDGPSGWPVLAAA
jgi:hypothetical protein